MRYSDKEAMNEIMKRGKNVSIKRIKQTNMFLSALSCLLFVSLVSVIAFIPNGSSDVTYSNETVYGVVISILFNRTRKKIDQA